MRTPARPCTLLILIALSLVSPAQSPQKPTPATAAWWNQTVTLSNDSMEGRDTGTEAYERAAKYVAEQFKSAGLKPAGDDGTFFQRVPMHQIALDQDKSSVEILGATGKSDILHFTTEVTTVPREQPSLIEAPMVFVGYGVPPADLDIKGKIAVFFNRSHPVSQPLIARPTPPPVFARSLKPAPPQYSPSTTPPTSNPSTGQPPTRAASPSPEQQHRTPTPP